MHEQEQTSRTIGGFFPLALPYVTREKSVWHHWGLDRKPKILLHNARSALAHLTAHLDITTLWLPAYSCQELSSTAHPRNITINYYPLTEALSPDITCLKKNGLQSGHALLAINYFGSSLSTDFISFTIEHPDIVWIEDAVQCMANQKSWGHYTLRSPRKLLGVPDGGIISCDDNKTLPDVQTAPHSNIEFMQPSILRLEDKNNKNNDLWYKSYVDSEKKMTISHLAMSQLTESILKTTAIDDLTNKRHQNAAILTKSLQDYLITPIADNPAPFGVPIRVKNRDALISYLAEHRIFVPVHWRDIPTRDFQFESELSNTLLTLPCDHRYDTEDMHYLLTQLHESGMLVAP